jgi:hypothetical protein
MKSVVVLMQGVIALNGAFVGVLAGFWHILWIAGATILACAILAAAVQSAGFVRLERDQEPRPP